MTASSFELQRVDTEILARLRNGSKMSEDNENTIIVNLISTVLLTLLQLPILHSPAFEYNIQPVISAVGLNNHGWTIFLERKTPKSLATLNDQETTNTKDRHASPRSLRLSYVASLQALYDRLAGCSATNTAITVAIKLMDCSK